MRPGTRIVVLCAIVVAAQAVWLLTRLPGADTGRAQPGEERLDLLAKRIGNYARAAGGLPREIGSLMCTREFSDAGSAGYLVDAYGAPIRYEVTGARTFRLMSFGADREPGGADVFGDRVREYDVDVTR
jgi:hypothetical protein